MNAERADLARAVDGLYVAFADRPLRDWTDPCLNCCATREQEAALHAVPLRRLALDVIGAYAADAMTTWGDERELAHFLPRMFEIVATDDFGWPDIEALLAKLGRAGWRRWSRAETAAVGAWLSAKWRDTLAGDPPVHPAGDVLCAIAQADDDLGPYLAAWDRDGRAASSRKLVDFVLEELRPAQPRLGNAWWKDRPDQEDQVLRWLASAPVDGRLTDLATSPACGDEADRALVALQAVGSLRA